MAKNGLHKGMIAKKFHEKRSEVGFTRYIALNCVSVRGTATQEALGTLQA